MSGDENEAQSSVADGGSTNAAVPEPARRPAATGRRRLVLVVAGTITGLLLVAAAGYAVTRNAGDPGANGSAPANTSMTGAPTGTATNAPTGSPTAAEPEGAGTIGPLLVGGGPGTGRAGQPADEPPGGGQIDSDDVVRLEEPTNLTITPISGSTIRLTWTDNSTGETGYLVSLFGESGWERRLPANTNRFDITGLAENTEYCLSVGAYVSGGGLAATGGCTRTLLPLPAAPSNLRAAVSNYNLIHLTWTDNSTNETGFRVGGSQGPIQDLAAGATSYTYLAPPAFEQGVEHCLRVQAVNYAGASAWTPWVCARTIPIPAPPSNITAQATSHVIEVRWSDNSAIETGYRIRPTGGLPTRTVPANTTSIVWDGLTPDTTYCFEVHTLPFDGGATDVTTCTRTLPAPPSDGS